MMSSIWEKIIRKQSLENVTSDSSLRKCLSVFDLTLMGLGSMIGSGIYVMTGKVIKDQAGMNAQDTCRHTPQFTLKSYGQTCLLSNQVT